MKVKLNFKLGEKTLNNRFYDKDVFIEEINRLLSEKKLFVLSGAGNAIVAIHKIIASVTGYYIEDDGTAWFDVKPIRLNELFQLESIELSSMCVGNMKEKNEDGIYEVLDFKLCYLFIVGQDEEMDNK